MSKRNQPSFSQILNFDNTLLMEVDVDNIVVENGHSSSVRSNKRKSECVVEQRDVNFKTPLVRLLHKKLEAASSSSSHLPEASNTDHESFSQQLFRSLDSQVISTLTQSSDCIKELKNDVSVTVIVNPVTCSQYVQVNHEEEQIDDTLNELFNVEQINDIPADTVRCGVEGESTVEDRSYLAALDHDTQIFRIVDEEILKSTPVSAASTSKSPHQQKALTPHRFRPVSSISFQSLGSFFGLTKYHKKFILQTKKIPSLYDWQEECLRLRAIYERTNLIYALPTSGGKTLVAEIAMFREMALRKKNVIFVLPYVSIVQEKVQDMMPFAVEFKFLIEEYCAGKGSVPPVKRRKKNVIYICTIEKSQILFDSLFEHGRLGEVGLIVVDELHMIGDSQRGYCLETLLAKAVFQKQSQIQIIGMSATISNLQEIAKFMKADVYTRDFRPVELKEYLKVGSELLLINAKARNPSDVFQVERAGIGSDYKPEILKQDPDHLGALVIECVPGLSCLIFCATKQNCENVSILLSKILPRELCEHKKDEKNNLMDCIKSDSNGRMCRVLARTIPYGVAYHHSGLTSDERKHIEEAYRLGILCVICCTSTLAAGVNLPAKRVIIRSPYIGPNFLTLTRYKQMVGRAGRAGKCETGESIMICEPKDHQKVADLFCSKMDETISGFVQDASGVLLRRVVLNLLGTKLASSIDDLVEFFKCSLLCVQTETVALRAKMVKSVQELMSEGALTFRTATKGNRRISFTIVIKDEHQTIFPDDVLEVSMLGKAAVNAGMSLEEAQKAETYLKKAHQNLVLETCLHLLFIVAPDESLESINPDNAHYNSILMRLDDSLLRTAKVVGISENLAMRLITKPLSIKEGEKELLKRFYVALILFELWNSKDIHQVASEYKVNRGIVYNLLNAASSKAFSVFKFCEMYEDFWLFKDLLDKFSKRLLYCCCSAELLPLMELPAVKIGRAKLLFAAGFKTVESIAASLPEDLVSKVANLNKKQADQIIQGAKHAIIEMVDTMNERIVEIKELMKSSRDRPT